MLPEGIHSLDLSAGPRHGFAVVEHKVITPGPFELYFGFGRKGMGHALSELDDGIRRGITALQPAGIKARVVAWNGVNAWVTGHAEDGRQVGYGHITLQPNISVPDLLGYESEYVVGSAFQRKGIATAMKNLLERYAASGVVSPRRGIGVLSAIRANGVEHIQASRRLLERLGAVPLDDKFMLYRRIILQHEENSPGMPGIQHLENNDVAPLVMYS